MVKNKLLWAAILAIGIILPLLVQNVFFHHVLFMIVLFVTLGEAWNLVGGYIGYVSFGHAVFFGLGAYVPVILFKNFGINPWVGMLFGALAAVIAAFVIAYPCFRLDLRGHYFAIATLAFAEIVAIAFDNWDYVGAARGIMIPIHDDSLILLQFKGKLPFYYIALAFMVFTICSINLLLNSKPGYYFRAIRENEEAAQSSGVNTSVYKHIAFLLSALLVAPIGTLYAHYNLYFDPRMVFHFMISTQMVLVALLGGLGTIKGPIMGACILITFSEYSRAWLGGGGRGLDIIFFGLLLVAITIFEPGGFISIIRRFRLRLGRTWKTSS
jgi:branched-chain amino acid transport system permease protein